jgi:N-acetylneuraminate synthase/N,N'-diacetyllegionaminate synthase
VKNTFAIAGREIGKGNPCFTIAEAGVNHNGDFELARQLIYAAKEAGADAVKFQTFKAANVVIPSAPKAAYQMRSTNPLESQLEMLHKLELSRAAHLRLKKLADDLGIIFLSTPADEEDVDFLEEVGVAAFKTASFQIVEPHLLRHIAQKRKPILMSTGMATENEVLAAVETVRRCGNEQLVILQCTTNYPSAIEDANLRAMIAMGTATNTNFGYSDHTMTSVSCLAAVALGACVVERHFTLDKNLSGPDHSLSFNPREFAQMVANIREVEAALGNSEKNPTETERINSVGMRRSIVSRVNIPKGAIIDHSMLAMKRPAVGISPISWDEVVGMIAHKDIAKDSIITWEDLAARDLRNCRRI